MKKRILSYSRLAVPLAMFFGIAFSSCNMDDGDFHQAEELGAVKKTYDVPATSGELKVPVLANLKYSVAVQADQDWMTVDAASLTGDDTIHVSHALNSGFPRMARIYLEGLGRADTVYIRQFGAENPKLELPETNVTVDGKTGGGFNAALNVNVNFQDVKVSILYTTDDDGWLSDIAYANGKLTFKAAPNATDKLRSARVTLSYVDGWDNTLSSTLQITQSTKDNLLGSEISFDALRLKSGGMIVDDIYIEGIIISDNTNPNVAANPSTTGTTLDYTVNGKTAYIQSKDGQLGFMIVAKTEDDNTFQRYSTVRILLKNAMIVKDENPERYSITGVEAGMVMTSVAGTAADLAPKVRTVETLTDDDVYTWVRIDNCEIPIREGSYVPINEGYASTFAVNRVNMYPLLMRGRNGGAMHINTNVNCPYRRDGSILPQGSGSITGIIVHEKYRHFQGTSNDQAPDDNYGFVSRYQIRHLAKSDIAIAQNFADGFSTIIAEWDNPASNLNPANATYGSGTMSQTSLTAFGLSNDYRFLGPIKTSAEGGTNDDKGHVASGGWNNGKWYENEKFHSWMFRFSTGGIAAATSLSMQITAVNSSVGAPRYWAAEWSEHGNQDGVWTRISEYTVPDIAQWPGTRMDQMAGYKNINIALPLEMLGKSTVYVRLIPVSDKVGTADSYDGGQITTDVKTSALGYVSIRYNQ